MVAIDRLPENSHYRDTGCDIAPRCLSCPLPECRYALPPKRAGALLREAQFRELLAAGLTVDQAAVQMGVTRRTVFRLKRYAAMAADPAVLVLMPPRPRPPKEVVPMPTLTPREREVLGWCAQGLGDDDIGRAIGIAPRTAKVHMARAMAKMGGTNRTGAACRALAWGLLPDAMAALQAGKPEERAP